MSDAPHGELPHSPAPISGPKKPEVSPAGHHAPVASTPEPVHDAAPAHHGDTSHNDHPPKHKQDKGPFQPVIEDPQAPIERWSLDSVDLQPSIRSVMKEMQQALISEGKGRDVLARTTLAPLTAVAIGLKTSADLVFAGSGFFRYLGGPAVAAVANMFITPSMFFLRRLSKGGESAAQAYLRYKIRENPSWWEKLTKGRESEAVSKVIFGLNRESQTLLSFLDENKQVDIARIRQFVTTPDDARKLITEGLYRGSMLAAIEQGMTLSGKQWSEMDKQAAERIKLTTQVANEMLKYTPNLTDVERSNFLYGYGGKDCLREMMKQREQADWRKELGAVTLEGMKKSFGLTMVLDFFTGQTFQKIGKTFVEGVKNVVTGIAPWVGEGTGYLSKQIADAATAVGNMKMDVQIRKPVPGEIGYWVNALKNYLGSIFAAAPAPAAP